MLKRNKKGFTLIEIMLVIIILSILTAMVVPRLAGRTEQARVASATADIATNIATGLDLYELDNGAYPATEQGVAALVLLPVTSPVPQNWKGPYLKKGIPKDPWGKQYNYKYPGSHGTDYDLFSAGPDGIEGNDDDIANWEIKTK